MNQHPYLKDSIDRYTIKQLKLGILSGSLRASELMAFIT